jgi:hypothetical protein
MTSEPATQVSCTLSAPAIVIMEDSRCSALSACAATVWSGLPFRRFEIYEIGRFAGLKVPDLLGQAESFGARACRQI